MATPFKQEVLTLEERLTSIEKRLTDLENIFGPGIELVRYQQAEKEQPGQEVEFLPDFDLTDNSYKGICKGCSQERQLNSTGYCIECAVFLESEI